MITRLSAKLESIEHDTIPIATLTPGAGIALEALLPRYLADQLEPKVSTQITLHTRTILEAQGQGTSFIPRLLGFGTPEERAFFEAFTSVKGLGAKKALRAMSIPPAQIAALIIAKDAKSLTKLPEIGKRLSETMIAELSGKVERFAGDAIIEPVSRAAAQIEPEFSTPAASEAVAALTALGEARPDAIRKVEAALTKLGNETTTDAIVQTVFAGA